MILAGGMKGSRCWRRPVTRSSILGPHSIYGTWSASPADARPRDDALPAADDQRWTDIVPGTGLRVVDDLSVHGAPDLHPELVGLAVDHGHHEAIAGLAIDRAGALVLGLCAGHDQVGVIDGVEADLAGLELERGLPARDAVLVLRGQAEVRAPVRCRRSRVSARGRVGPTAARDEAGGRVVDGDECLSGIRRVVATSDRRPDLV